MSDFVCISTPKARKRYSCEICHCDIYKFEKHSKSVGLQDGQMFQYRSHLDCVDIQHKFVKFYDVSNEMFDEGEFIFLFDYLSQADDAEYVEVLNWIFDRDTDGKVFRRLFRN